MQKNEAVDVAEVDMVDPDLTETDMAPLYDTFLMNEISVSNPCVEGMTVSVMDNQEYESEFEGTQKSYILADVNGDEKPEFIFRISAYPSRLMYVLGIYNDEYICFDVMETHTTGMTFGVYDYGMVWKSQNYDGFERAIYTLLMSCRAN